MLISQIEFSTSKRCQLDQPLQLGALVTHHAKEIDHITVEIVVDLDLGGMLVHQNRCSTRERLSIAAMVWEVADDPIGLLVFAAVIA